MACWTCYGLMLRKKTCIWNRGGWMADLCPQGHKSSRGFSGSWRLMVGGQPSTAVCTPGQQSSPQSLFLSSTPPSAGQFCAPVVRGKLFWKKEKKKHIQTNRHCGACSVLLTRGLSENILFSRFKWNRYRYRYRCSQPTFSSLRRLSCSWSRCTSASSLFRSSWKALCCALRQASSSSSITSSRDCSIVFPTRTSNTGCTSMSKSNSCRGC